MISFIAAHWASFQGFPFDMHPRVLIHNDVPGLIHSKSPVSMLRLLFALYWAQGAIARAQQAWRVQGPGGHTRKSLFFKNIALRATSAIPLFHGHWAIATQHSGRNPTPKRMAARAVGDN